MAAVTWLPTALGLAAAVVAVLAVVPGGLLPAGIAVLGLCWLALGRYRHRRRHVTQGAVLLFVGVVLAGLARVPDWLVLVGTFGTVVAWDATENTLAVRRQLGPAATTTRSELVHVGATTLAAAAIVSITLVTAVVARGRLPGITGIVLVGGAILLIIGVVPFARGRPR